MKVLCANCGVGIEDRQPVHDPIQPGICKVANLAVAKADAFLRFTSEAKHEPWCDRKHGEDLSCAGHLSGPVGRDA